MDNVAKGWTLLWATVNGMAQDEDNMAGLGGVFIGDTDLGVSGLRDMTVRTSGPEKMECILEAQNAIEFIRENVLPILRGNS